MGAISSSPPIFICYMERCFLASQTWPTNLLFENIPGEILLPFSPLPVYSHLKTRFAYAGTRIDCEKHQKGMWGVGDVTIAASTSGHPQISRLCTLCCFFTLSSLKRSKGGLQAKKIKDNITAELRHLWMKHKLKPYIQTLPYAQRTQGIESVT